jgi:hypothetical protein
VLLTSIAASEINGRLDTRYLPRGTEETKVNEMLSAASEWLVDLCDAEDEQSEAFESTSSAAWAGRKLRCLTTSTHCMSEEVEVVPREMCWDAKAGDVSTMVTLTYSRKPVSACRR